MSDPKTHLPRFLTRYHFSLALTLILGLLVWEGWFLYLNFYRALVAAKNIRELHEQPLMEQVDLPLYQNLMKFYTTRQNQHPLNTTTWRNPFVMSIRR